MRGIRIALVVGGVLLLGWGAWLMLSRQDVAQLLSAALWLGAVVVVHDGLLAAASAARHHLRRSVPTSETHERPS
ncbi:hypothetical protein [Microbacterium sp. NPDC087665]|uniref:hypothetical protein n=1 Tax=Microbacterium sp. NPDC087665 TaxID=3364194 RepID=UPI00381401E6